MYNRYLQNSCPPQEPPKPPCEPAREEQTRDHTCWDAPKHDNSGLLSHLTRLFGGKEGGLRKLLDDNTLLVLLILYFLLKDEDGIDHDLLLLAGIFLLLDL